jgi:foldase protein PrsA
MASSANIRKQPKKQMSKKNRTTLIVAISVAVALLIGGTVIFSACNAEKYKQLAADRKTVATCNGYEIPYEELRFVTMFYKDHLENKYGEGIWDDPATAEAHRDELEELVTKNLNQNYLILSACRNLGVATEGKDVDKYVNDQVKELKAAFETNAEYKKWLEEHWMSESYLKFSVGVSFLESAIYYTLLDSDRFLYSQKNIGDFIEYVITSGDYVRTIHIYIENAEGEDPAANLKKAEEASAILQGITDPDERREKFGDYIGSTLNDDFQSISGDGYYFTRREMDEDYENAAFDLEIGEVSDPVVSSGGTFIIMRLSPEEDYVIKNCQTLLNNYHSVAVGIYEEQFTEDCRIIFNEYGASIDLVAMQ